MSDKKTVARPALFAMIYPLMVDVGRELGYAMAVHGSLATDLDVIAVPWTDEACSPQELFDAVVERVGGMTLAELGHPGHDPFSKPHGRLVWTLVLGLGAYIDLCVMPRAAAATPSRREGEP